MWSWDLALWGIGFLGETYGWVVARATEAWGTVVSIAVYLTHAGLGVQLLIAVLYIAVGVWFAFRAEPVGAQAVVWYDRVALAALWLPASALMLGSGLVMMAYTVGVMMAFYAGVFGLVLLPYEAAIRGVLSLLER